MWEFFVNLFVQPWNISKALFWLSIQEIHYWGSLLLFFILDVYYFGFYIVFGLPVLLVLWPWLLYENGPLGVIADLWYYFVQVPFELWWEVTKWIWDINVIIWTFIWDITSTVYNWVVGNIYTFSMELYTLNYSYISEEQAWLHDEYPFDGSVFNAENPDFRFGFLWAYFDGLTKFKYLVFGLPIDFIVWVWDTYYSIITYPYVLTMNIINWTISFSAFLYSEQLVPLFYTYLEPFYYEYLVTGF